MSAIKYSRWLAQGTRVGIGSALWGLILLPMFLLSSPAADISYVYDDAGRLRAVIDPASDTAIYAYDSVGNLTGITRQPRPVGPP